MALEGYLVAFSEKCLDQKVKQYVVECLKRENFSVIREEFEGKTLLTVSGPFELLAAKVC